MSWSISGVQKGELHSNHFLYKDLDPQTLECFLFVFFTDTNLIRGTLADGFHPKQRPPGQTLGTLATQAGCGDPTWWRSQVHQALGTRAFAETEGMVSHGVCFSRLVCKKSFDGNDGLREHPLKRRWWTEVRPKIFPPSKETEMVGFPLIFFLDHIGPF